MKVTSDKTYDRLDVFISEALGISRSKAAQLIKDGRVSPCDDAGARLRASSKVEGGRSFGVTLPEERPAELQPEDIELDVIYEDDDLAVISKPAGLVVHPAPGNGSGTLVNAMLHRWPHVRNVGEPDRPGIVHRLDASTSGLMVIALNERTLAELQRMFKERLVTKEYLALVHGRMTPPSGTLSGPIGRDPRNPLRNAVIEGGREALTGYRALWTKKGPQDALSLVLCRLFTGRTHQIRVHLAAAGHPIYGDRLYEAPASDALDRVFLHSWRLAFVHPSTGAEMKFRVPLPAALRDVIIKIDSGIRLLPGQNFSLH